MRQRRDAVAAELRADSAAKSDLNLYVGSLAIFCQGVAADVTVEDGDRQLADGVRFSSWVFAHCRRAHRTGAALRNNISLPN
jgi:hypothetical protein